MKKILFKLLLLHDTEAQIDLKDDEDTLKKLDNLIICVNKSILNIRYCSIENCACHPESQIQLLLKDTKLVAFLNNNSKNIVSNLLNLCENYKPVIADGIFED